MSHGPGRLQRAILELMRQWVQFQRTPQRQHWQVGDFVRKIIHDDPETGAVRPMTGRQMADARKQVRRACDSLAAMELVIKVRSGWELPPETPSEARARRKRRRISAKEEQRQEQRAAAWERETAWMHQAAPTIDRDARAKRIKKLARILGKLGSNVDNEVIMAAQQAERVRTDELNCSWEDLLK